MAISEFNNPKLRWCHRRGSFPTLVVLLTLVITACVSGPMRREVPVDVLWYNEGTKVGGFSRAIVSVEPNDADRIRVGVIEESALQLGDLWRASIWLAAFQASLALSRPLSDWLVFVELDHAGRGMDGPSAGALLTAAILAGMTGASVDRGFSMTGTINPDGTIGPVSGIPQKFRAAIAQGKTHLGFPLGQDEDKDLETGASVPVRELSGDSTTVIEEVPDIETAYELMTGRTLPRPKPLELEAMALPVRVRETLAQQARTWLSSAESNYQDYMRLNIVDAWLKGYWDRIDKGYGDVMRALERKEVVGAYIESAALFVDADSALLYGNILQRVRDGRYEDAVNYVGTIMNTVDARLVELVGVLKTDVARSTSELMTLVDAFEAFGSSVRHFGAALTKRDTNKLRVDELILGLRQKRIPLTPEVQNELVELLYMPMRELSLANVSALVCKQNLGFRPDVPPEAKAVNQAYIDRLQKLFRVAGNTNLSYFETLVIQTIANAHGVSRDKVRANFSDATYQHVLEAPRAMMEATLEQHFGSGTAALSLVRLSTAFNTYVNAAFLIAKYYSLDAETNEDGAIVRIAREHVLSRMLSMAETKALEHAARVRQATGEVPLAARIAFEAGRQFAGRPDVHTRLASLEQFWRASMLSQMAVLLRR